MKSQNASLADVELPHSRMKEGIAKILKKEGYVEDYGVEGKIVKTLKVTLKYQGRKPVVEGLKRISRPGLRQYVAAEDIPRVRGGLGVAIMSTSRGVITGVDARKQNVGGEVVCYIW